MGTVHPVSPVRVRVPGYSYPEEMHLGLWVQVS